MFSLNRRVVFICNFLVFVFLVMATKVMNIHKVMALNIAVLGLKDGRQVVLDNISSKELGVDGEIRGRATGYYDFKLGGRIYVSTFDGLRWFTAKPDTKFVYIDYCSEKALQMKRIYGFPALSPGQVSEADWYKLVNAGSYIDLGYEKIGDSGLLSIINSRNDAYFADYPGLMYSELCTE